MFYGAIVFNQNLSTWNVSNVPNDWQRTDMFYNATAMNIRWTSLPDSPDPSSWSSYW
jgi:surface protein